MACPGRFWRARRGGVGCAAQIKGVGFGGRLAYGLVNKKVADSQSLRGTPPVSNGDTDCSDDNTSDR